MVDVTIQQMLMSVKPLAMKSTGSPVRNKNLVIIAANNEVKQEIGEP